MSNDAAVANADRPFVLVVGLDLTDSESSGYAVNQAARIATRIPGSQMHLLQVLLASANAGATREAAAVLERYASAKATELGGLPGQSVGVHIRSGEAGREIAQFAHDVTADMIIVGSHHRPHLKQLLVGSTAEHVMATAACPVFVAGPRPAPQPSHIIVIEPPCPDCVKARQATSGRSWWCARHSEHHHLHHSHRYSFQSDAPFESHDSAVSPTGV
jgi:nucleotide-binding universal stress UspA family protein